MRGRAERRHQMHRWWMARLSMAAVTSAFCALAFPLTAAETISGTVSAIHDGDTLTLDGSIKIRVFGIDAPELKQQCRSAAGACEPCGDLARQALTVLTLGKSIACEVRGKSYNRIVGECSVGDTQIGPWMLSHGQAVAYEHYLKARDRFAYMGAQEAAKRAQVGIWAQAFIPMEDWRHHRERLECER